MRFWILVLLAVMFTGCAAQAPKTTVKPANDFRPRARCKVLGKAKTSHVAVMVEKDCFRPGLTTVGIVVLNPEKKGTVAADHAAQAMIAILGFRPALQMIVASKHKRLPFMLAAVVDRATVAQK